MAKPINLYQGAAPVAMSQMGAGLAEAGANIGRSMQQGYQSLGQGLAAGITAAADAYKQYKQDQAQFDATKKLYKAFEGYLPEEARKNVQGIFADTTMSVSEKNKLSPMLFNMLGQAQQQSGRERLADIMNQGRLDVATTRKPTPLTGSSFGGVPTIDSILNLPVNPSQGNPAPLQEQSYTQPSTQSGQPASRIGPNGQMEVWSSRLGRYVELDSPMQDIQY